MTESFFHTLKGHVVHGSVFATRKEANAVLFDYIEIYYNQVRRHSANGWLSPEAFKKKYFKNLEGFVVHDTVQDQNLCLQDLRTITYRFSVVADDFYRE